MIVPLTPVRCMYRGVDLYGKKVGVVSGQSRFTYAQFGERVRTAGRRTDRPKASEPGDRVAYLSFNNNALLEGYYGVVLARAVVMPLNVRLTPPELVAILNHSEARMLIFENDFAPLVEHIRKACPGIARYVTIDETSPHGGFDLRRIAEPRPHGAPRYLHLRRKRHRRAVLHQRQHGHAERRDAVASHAYLHALAVAGTFNHDDTAVELHTIPLFHANGWGRPQASTMMGVKQVMVRRFEPTLVFRLIQEEKATAMSLVPTMANALLNAPDSGQFDLSSLREIHVGGAAASPELIGAPGAGVPLRCRWGIRAHRDLPGAHVGAPQGHRRLCGRSRTAGGTRPWRAGPYRASRSAWWIWTCSDVPRDMQTIGEVVIRGDRSDGRLLTKTRKARRAVMTDGWFHTGDMAVWDEENYIHIVDRKKDIIISGGENISSIEVEKAIFAHPAVLECAVVAAPDSKWGEIPAAFVVLKPGQTLTRGAALRVSAARIARFKIPRMFEFLETPLPKTGTGKIVKRELREMFWTGKTRRVQG